MRLAADLHVHSRFSRATSREADLAGYHRWARIKGIDIVGTGDFTHPGWFAELSTQLVEKDGLFVLRNAPLESPLEGIGPAARDVRFALTTEISSIYRKNGRVRKVHSLIGVRSLEDARRLGARLAAIGNVASDGRPILGLDPKDLLSILLETAGDAFFIPAHIWTPWFSLFGSRSGFDAIEECFEELTPHIFALETGLSSDPAMNRRWSALDRYRLVSNSDAHSPGNLGREATLLDVEPTWDGVSGALRTGAGFIGTVEFYPEEGKYHFDGHRKCGVCLDPEETARSGGKCPVCGSPLTIGVLSRVLGLADRRVPAAPRPSEGYRCLIPLSEVLGELLGTGSGSKAVGSLYGRLIGSFGSEYGVLMDAPVVDIARSYGALLAEAVRRMRDGKINPTPGYDGEFGVIRVFDDAELQRLRGQDELFAFPARRKKPGKDFDTIPRVAPGVALDAGPGVAPALAPAATPAEAPAAPGGTPPPGSLDSDQEAIAASQARRVLVAAGPGSGKTRLLVGWITRMAGEFAGAPGRILALTFTNRAAAELSARLPPSLPVTASTFHSFCWSVLRGCEPRLLSVLSPSDRITVLESLCPQEGPFRLHAMAERMEQAWEGLREELREKDPELREVMRAYDAALAGMGAADVSSLVPRVLQLLRSDPDLRARLTRQYRALAVDELQDINRPQFELLLLLCRDMEGVFCIGDPDQAIYGFRGSDRKYFFQFADETGAQVFTLRRNYRSSGAIVSAADTVISLERAAGVPALVPVRQRGSQVVIVPCVDPTDEGRFIGSEIRDMVGGVDSVSVDAARARHAGEYSFSDIAVLTRTRAVRDALLPGLLDAGLPLHLGVHAPLSEEEPFRSVVAALRLVLNPDDLVARRILSARSTAVLARGPELSRAAAGGICAALDLVAGPIVALDRSVPEISLGEEAIRASAARHGSDLAGFLAHVSLCARESEGPRAPQRISVLTFHAAKGLEFPVVFIAGAEEGITPLESERGVDLAEERRLFYVAMTRARDHLRISHCRHRARRGVLRETRPSRFLGGIDAETHGVPQPRRRDSQLKLF